MLVKIYIETITTGRFDCCDGKCSCVLEVTQNGQPMSKTHYKRWTNTTIQRLQIRACIMAMEHMTRASEIEIHINAPALVSQFPKRKEETARNADLWNKFISLCGKHKVTMIHEKRNICTRAMRNVLKTTEIEAEQDRQENTTNEEYNAM